MEIKYSIIIPVKEVNHFIIEHIALFRNFTRKDLELIILPNERVQVVDLPKNIKFVETGRVSPALKRDLGASTSHGKFLVFLDDDAFVHETFFSSLDDFFYHHPWSCVGGPAITPTSNSSKQRASGAVYESSFLSSNPERYLAQKKLRFVDDWPSVNLSLPKETFTKIGGFENTFWPGEDTMFCLKAAQCGVPIIYNPSLIAFHNRRETLRSHIKQTSGYGFHRGYFARRYPENSRKLKYFLPSLSLAYLIVFFTISLVTLNRKLPELLIFATAIPIILYLIGGMASLIEAKTRHPFSVVLYLFVYFPLTHFTYAINFAHGLFSKSISESALR